MGSGRLHAAVGGVADVSGDFERKSGATAIVPMGAGPVHGGVSRVRIGPFDARTQRFPGSSGGRWGDLPGRRRSDDL